MGAALIVLPERFERRRCRRAVENRFQDPVPREVAHRDRRNPCIRGRANQDRRYIADHRITLNGLERFALLDETTIAIRRMSLVCPHGLFEIEFEAVLLGGTRLVGDASMLEDAAGSSLLEPEHPDPSTLDALVRERQPHVVTYEDWSRLDALELSRGEAGGRPRVKFTSRAEMRAALKAT